MTDAANNPALTNAALTSYLAALDADSSLTPEGTPYYTHHAVLLETKPSRIIHADATSTPSTHHKLMVFARATTCDYECLFHCVSIDALGRLCGALKLSEAA